MGHSHSRKRVATALCIMLLFGVLMGASSCRDASPADEWSISCEDDLVEVLRTSELEFKRYEIGDWVVYQHRRMIDGAKVEFDRIWYKFDKGSGELLEKDVRWRDDLPDHLPPVIPKEQAEAMVQGPIHSTALYYISPESDVYPIEPAPKNPCWVVKIADDEDHVVDIVVIDAVEGKVLGHGMPPP